MKTHCRSRVLPDGGRMDYTYFEAMHTRVDILTRVQGLAVVGAGQWTEAPREAVRLAGEVAEAVARLEKVGNRFDPESELSRANRLAHDDQVTLSPTLYDILNRCLILGRRTGWLFDITAGSPGHTPMSPHQVFLSADGTLYLNAPQLRLDLSGVLKGFALEAIRATLAAHGVAHALVSMGTSSILAMGDYRGQGSGWPVALRPLRPEGDECDGGHTLALHDECLTTSGNDTPTRAHIIHPMTGEVVTGLRTATVITSDGVEGEALSTACFLASPAQLELLKREFHPRRVITTVPARI